MPELRENVDEEMRMRGNMKRLARKHGMDGCLLFGGMKRSQSNRNQV